MTRLDKLTAVALSVTRSRAREIIRSGRVTVDGERVTAPDKKVDESSSVRIDGVRADTPEFLYILLYKPSGVITASRDRNASTVMDLIKDRRKGLEPVGRLDRNTSGALLITDDGLLNHRLLSKKYHVDKTYVALTDGRLTEKDRELFASGMDLPLRDGSEKLLPACVKVLSDDTVLNYRRLYTDLETELSDDHLLTETEITLHQGRYHQVRRMFEAVDKPVIYLKRVSFGPLNLSGLKAGESRYLTKEEINSLKELTGLSVRENL